MNKTRMAWLAVAGFACASAQADVYNLSATKSPRDFTGITVGANPNLQGNGYTFSNATSGALTYIVTPFDGSTTAATDDYEAARRFGSVSLPKQGWEWSYWVQIDGGSLYQVGFGGGIGDGSSGPPPWNGYGVGGVPAIGSGDYTDTAAEAFATAPTHSFSLAAGQSAKVFFMDDIWSDNTGGVSIDVTVVPEPQAYGLALAGLGMVALMLRRRQRRA